MRTYLPSFIERIHARHRRAGVNTPVETLEGLKYGPFTYYVVPVDKCPSSLPRRVVHYCVPEDRILWSNNNPGDRMFVAITDVVPQKFRGPLVTQELRKLLFYGSDSKRYILAVRDEQRAAREQMTPDDFREYRQLRIGGTQDLITYSTDKSQDRFALAEDDLTGLRYILDAWKQAEV